MEVQTENASTLGLYVGHVNFTMIQIRSDVLCVPQQAPGLRVEDLEEVLQVLRLGVRGLRVQNLGIADWFVVGNIPMKCLVASFLWSAQFALVRKVQKVSGLYRGHSKILGGSKPRHNFRGGLARLRHLVQNSEVTRSATECKESYHRSHRPVHFGPPLCNPPESDHSASISAGASPHLKENIP